MRRRQRRRRLPLSSEVGAPRAHKKEEEEEKKEEERRKKLTELRPQTRSNKCTSGDPQSEAKESGSSAIIDRGNRTEQSKRESEKGSEREGDAIDR